MVDRGNANGINILIFNELSVVLVVSDLFTDDTLGLVHAGLGDVAHGNLSQIAFALVTFHTAHVRLALTSDADVAYVDPFVGSDHSSGRRCLTLPVDRGLDDV